MKRKLKEKYAHKINYILGNNIGNDGTQSKEIINMEMLK